MLSNTARLPTREKVFLAVLIVLIYLLGVVSGVLYVVLNWKG